MPSSYRHHPPKPPHVRVGGVPIEVERAAVRGVAAAMAVTRRLQRSLHDGDARPHASFLKPDDSPVTVADFAVQTIVTQYLREALGDGLHLIGEESAAALRGDGGHDRSGTRAAVTVAVQSACPDLDEDDVLELLGRSLKTPPTEVATEVDPTAPGTAKKPERTWWLIDPIDGTKGFLRGAQYCIALAFVRSGRVRFAILGCPNLDDDPRRSLDSHPEHGALFVAHHDGGCTVRNELDPETALRPVRRPPAPDQHAIRVCESVVQSPTGSARATSVIDRAIASTGRHATGMRLDSQCKYALVARDQADIYLRLPRRSLPIESAWDHAAGALVAQEGGAWVSDLDGKPLDFSLGASLERNRGVLACDASLASSLLEAVRVTGAATLPPAQPEGGH